MKTSAPGRRAGTPFNNRTETWRHLRRWLTWRVPTHRKDPA